MTNHRDYHGKRKQPTNEEEDVDDLLIASMAVASTWMPSVEMSSTSKSDGSSDDGSDVDCKDADEISLDGDSVESADIKELEKTSAPEEGVSSSHLEAEQNNGNDTLDAGIKEDESDDESEIDLTENLANMLDEDEEPKRKDTKDLGIYEGPKTEHEIDPYAVTCPIDELARLDFVGKEKGIDETTKSKLRVAGVVRSYLVEQRTVVVDSLIPASLNQSNSMNEPLDEGSVMAILLANGSDGTYEIATVDEASSLQILGKVIEVFGPVQRPLYVIRLPDPANVENKLFDKKRDDIKSDESNLKVESVIADKSVMSEGLAVEARLSLEAESQTDTRTEDNTFSDTSPVAATSDKRKLSDISEVDDPWSANGKLSAMLRSTANAIIYSVMDHSTVINKEQIIKISGKGCDASNMFDEEVGPSEMQDFSDDEDERLAKKGNRKSRQPSQNNDSTDRSGRPNNFAGRSGGRSGGRGRGRGRGRGHVQSTISNNTHHQPFYLQQQVPMQQPYYNQNAPQLQQMYLQQGYQNLHQGGQQHYQHRPQQSNYGGLPGYYGAPPPPPPPPQQHPNANTGNQSHNPALQSDTVYYDYSGS
ncbi:hypothetical protein ACHAXN_007255 [Cyclotella atomus]